jgi:hypothetical protein
MRTLLSVGVFFTIMVAPTMLLAQSDYIPLVGVPGLSGQDLNTGSYVNALYVLAISIAAFLAFAKLTYAGVKYVLSDVVTSKESAKKDIQWSLVGLLIVIGAVLILNTINPQLTNLNALSAVRSNPIQSNLGTGVNVVGGNAGSGSGTDVSAQIAACQGNPNGVLITRFSGLNQRTVCCTAGNTDPLCVGVVYPNNQSTSSPNTFPQQNAAQTAADACGGTVTGSRGNYSVLCPILPTGSAPNQNYLAAIQQDLQRTFTVNDPADPQLGLTQGPDHGEQIRIRYDQSGAGQPGASLVAEGTHVFVEFSDGRVTAFPCGLLTPRPQVCN